MCVLFSPVPATQLHPSVQWAPARTGLCSEQVILRVEMMGDSKAYLSWDKLVHVPVNCHTMNVPSCMNITKDLEAKKDESKLSFHVKCVQEKGTKFSIQGICRH